MPKWRSPKTLSGGQICAGAADQWNFSLSRVPGVQLFAVYRETSAPSQSVQDKPEQDRCYQRYHLTRSASDSDHTEISRAAAMETRHQMLWGTSFTLYPATPGGVRMEVWGNLRRGDDFLASFERCFPRLQVHLFRWRRGPISATCAIARG